MEKILHLLIVEDMESDAEILKRIITRDGIKFVDRIVETKEDFVNAISEFSPDLILSDYSLPQFNGMTALRLRQELAPHVPFVLVTGSINEEVAVECMKAGADDYIIKQNLIRLIPAIKGAILKQETIRLRWEAEIALKESEEQLKFALSGTNDGIWDVNMVTNDIYLSPRGCEILGYKPGEFQKIVNQWNHLVHPDDIGATNEALTNYLEGRAPLFIIEQRLRTSTGDFRWILTRGKAVSYDQNGKALRMVGTHTDFTDRKQTEEVIRKERILMRTLIDNLPDTIYAKDIEGRKILANLADIQISGYTSESEIMGKTDRELFPGEIGKNGLADDLDVLQNIKPIINQEGEFIDARGNRHWLLTSKIPLLNEQGIVTGLVGIGHDISERKRMEDDLRKLSGAVEQNPVAIIITDINGVIEYVNPRFTDLTGYSREETIGKNPRLFKSGATTREQYKQLWETIRSGRAWHGELQNKKKNGEFYFESVLISPISDNQGHFTHFLASMEDISDRKSAEDDIRQKVEELAVSNEALTRFNRLAIGREMRMIEIKKQCNHLAAQLGIEQPYPLAFLKDNQNAPVPEAMSSATENIESEEI